jgi:ABC-type Fe3+ transport system permease subunit
MSTGLGILLSSVVLALVMLYAITKDRWRWRQIARISALALALTGVVIGGLYLWNQLPANVSPQTEYEGVRLGMTPDEVMYIRGSPTLVLGGASRV